MRHQAFRAANQAIGRCIRHKADYGRCCCCLLAKSLPFIQCLSNHDFLSVFSSLTRASVRRTGKSQRHIAHTLPHAAVFHSYPQPSLSSKVDSRPNEQVQCKRRTTPVAFCCLHNHQPQYSSCPIPAYMHVSACSHIPSGCPNTPTFFRSHGKRVSIEN